jgi:hypothetical protein
MIQQQQAVGDQGHRHLPFNGTAVKILWGRKWVL